ncbi:MAG: DUF2007 domain-containing protein [Sphingomonadaceae bacterium]
MTGGEALVELLTVHDVTLAEILRGRLAADGIEALLFDANFAGLLGGGYPGIRLMVSRKDALRARAILDGAAEDMPTK